MSKGAEVPSDPRLDAYALLARDQRLAMEASAVIEQYFSIGPHVARLRFAGTTLVDPLTQAIAHLRREPVVDPGLTINIWDSETTGVPLSPLLRALVDAMHGDPFSVLTPRHEIAVLCNDRIAATFELGSGVLTFFDRQENEAIYWVRDPTNAPVLRTWRTVSHHVQLVADCRRRTVHSRRCRRARRRGLSS